MWKNKRKAITFSFDDGVTQDVRLVEMFNKLGLKCTFNLNSACFGVSGNLKCCGKVVNHNKVKAEDVKEIYKGHEVACHTLTHPDLTKLDDKAVIWQIEEDRKALEDLCGYRVRGMAYPCGTFDDRVVKLIKENTPILYSRTTQCTYDFKTEGDLLKLKATCWFGDERIFSLAEKFIEDNSGENLLFYIWGHSYEIDADNPTWEKFEELCKYLSDRADVFYGTNSQVLLK